MLAKVVHSLAKWVLHDIPGGAGQRLRYAYWRRRFARCGRNVRIDQGVIFHNPGQIEIGDDVWIMAYAVLSAPTANPGQLSSNKTVLGEAGSGRLRIGSQVQIGLYNVVNGAGGLDICDFVTMAARVSLYSATHLHRDPCDPERLVGTSGMVHSRPVFSRQRQMRIGTGVFLGLGASVICADVGDEAFVQCNGLVTRDLPANVELAPDGRTRLRHGGRKAG